METETAAQILSAGRAAQAASAAKQASYDRYLSSREIERREVGNAAFRSAHDDRLRTELRGWNSEDKRMTTTSTMPLSPQGLSAAREAHAEALREFDRKHPPAPFDEFRG